MENGTLNTNQLIARIEEELDLHFDRNTITAWTRLPEDRPPGPMPVAYQGRPGQGHGYDWDDVLEWLERYFEEQDKNRPEKSGVDDLDFHGARTLEMRERAKQARMVTMERAGSLASVTDMEAVAEDLSRRAVEMLMAIPDRLAAQLSAESDENEVHRKLDTELRRVCDLIAGVADEIEEATAIV